MASHVAATGLAMGAQRGERRVVTRGRAEKAARSHVEINSPPILIASACGMTVGGASARCNGDPDGCKSSPPIHPTS